jgi:hypothetical protein
MTHEIQAAQAWSTNADLILDVFELGYIREADYVLDPTYGRGTWWARYKPQNLTIHDIALDGVDFRKLPRSYGNRFDVIAFDPPYVSTGGRTTSTTSEFNERYGLVETPRTPKGLQSLICEGMVELRRCMVPHGIMLVKCMNYISSGKYFAGRFFTEQHGLALGLDIVDEFVHIGAAGMQPPGRRQKHARNNYSTLIVFRSRR